MKILMLVPQPFFQIRGTPLAILQILRSLSGKGNEIDLVTYHLGEDVAIPDIRIHRIPRVPFIRRVKIGPSLPKLVLDAVLCVKVLALLLRRRYDVIHAVEESVFPAMVFKWLFGKPVVYDMDSVISDQLYYTRFTRSRLLLRMVRACEYWAIHHSVAVLTVCQALSDEVRRIHPGKKIFQVEDIPVEDSEVPVDGQILNLLRRELGVENRRVFLYTGNFESYQGVDLLVEAVARLRDETLCLVLVGGEEPLLGRMEELARRLGCANRVRFTGRRPVNEMPIFMQLADFLVSPRREGTNTPLKIYSYMRAGKPILATNLLTHNQVLHAGNALLVDSTPEGLAGGMRTLLSDAALCARIAQAARRDTDEKYNYQTLERKIGELYAYVQEQTAGGGKPR